MKYIVDLPDAYTSESALFGDILSIPICLEGGKRYGIPTGIKLEPYTEPDREAIEDEVWEFARKVEYMDIREREEAFNIHYPFNQMSYKEAKSKYEVWKRTKEIRVGDEVEYDKRGRIMCNHELKRLFYTSDDDYDIQSCRVELENEKDKYTLCYCEKCGQVFVMEITEKKNESLAKPIFVKCKE